MKTLFAAFLCAGVLYSCSSGTTHEDTNGASTGDMPTNDEYQNTNTDGTMTDTATMGMDGDTTMGTGTMPQ